MILQQIDANKFRLIKKGKIARVVNYQGAKDIKQRCIAKQIVLEQDIILFEKEGVVVSWIIDAGDDTESAFFEKNSLVRILGDSGDNTVLLAQELTSLSKIWQTFIKKHGYRIPKRPRKT